MSMDRSESPIRLPNAFPRAIAWSSVVFVLFFLSILNKDQTYLDGARFQKAAFFGLISAFISFTMIFSFVSLRRQLISRDRRIANGLLKVTGVVVILATILLTASHALTASQADAFVPIDHWTPKRKLNVAISCMSEFDQKKEDALVAHAYCECLQESIQKRWGYGEYLRNFEVVTSILKKENAPLICSAIAAAKKKRFDDELKKEAAIYNPESEPPLSLK